MEGTTRFFHNVGIRYEVCGGELVVRPETEADFQKITETAALRLLKRAPGEGAVVVDLGAVDISIGGSAAVSALLILHRATAEDIALRNVPPTLREIIRILGLDETFGLTSPA
jgi:anti-anti-sigma regulatory factor